jgi:glycosyltransferase involved in cell wall biosynthesis
LGLNDAITFSGAATHDEIAVFARNASFYIQTSQYEGMAMSVVEAMQMGLVPVVTAVGEIRSYCRNGYNGIVVESDQQSVEAILQLLHSKERYQALRSAAIATWKDQPLYRDSILQACKDMYYGI